MFSRQRLNSSTTTTTSATTRPSSTSQNHHPHESINQHFQQFLSQIKVLPFDVRLNIIDFIDVDFGMFDFEFKDYTQVLPCLMGRTPSTRKIVLVFRCIQTRKLQYTSTIPLLSTIHSFTCCELSSNQLSLMSNTWLKLTKLHIGYQSKVVDQWVTLLLDCKSLKSLSIESCERLSHNALANIFLHPSLTYLRLNRVTFSSLDIFNALKGNQLLRTLELSHRNGDLWLSDDIFILLSQHCNIHHLLLSNFLITGNYHWLSSQECKLKTLSLANCEIQSYANFFAEMTNNASLTSLGFAVQSDMEFTLLNSLVNKRNLKRLEIDSGVWFHQVDVRQMLQLRRSLEQKGVQFIEWP